MRVRVFVCINEVDARHGSSRAQMSARRRSARHSRTMGPVAERRIMRISHEGLHDES